MDLQRIKDQLQVSKWAADDKWRREGRPEMAAFHHGRVVAFSAALDLIAQAEAAELEAFIEKHEASK